MFLDQNAPQLCKLCTFSLSHIYDVNSKTVGNVRYMCYVVISDEIFIHKVS